MLSMFDEIELDVMMDILWEERESDKSQLLCINVYAIVRRSYLLIVIFVLNIPGIY